MRKINAMKVKVTKVINRLTWAKFLIVLRSDISIGNSKACSRASAT